MTLLALAPSAEAIPIAADWVTTASGNLNGVAFTTTGFGGPFLNIPSRNYAGADFAAALVGAAEALSYSANDDWSVTFDSPVSNLLIVVDLWRGNYSGPPPPPDPTTTYAFDQPFSIASGMTGGASIVGNNLLLPDFENFYSGVLLFGGPITTLSVDATAFNASGQLITFAVNATAVPEPSTLLLGATAVASVAAFRRIRRKRGGSAAG